ncbi:MAG: type II secretion system F family protein [Acidobacteriota bacterium]|nr:type II secretion system F family protein [Acidobacteriota bacterium]
MILLLTILTFSLTFGISAVLASRYWRRPNASLDRVLDSAALPSSGPRAPHFFLVQIPRLIGGAVNKGRGREQLKRDFIRAGIRSPHAESVFNGMRVIASIAGLAVVTAGMVLRHAELATTIMGAVGGASGGLFLPGEILKIRIRRRRRKIEKALPNALDLLTIGVEAGLGLDQAIVHVSQELSRAHPEISEEFNIIHLETRAGKRRSDALRSLAERTAVLEVKKLTAVLIQADRFGTSIAQTLRAHSEHLRVQARQTAEEKAAKLGVKLVFPIFFFILPSLFVITVGPVVVRIFQELLPMMNSM